MYAKEIIFPTKNTRGFWLVRCSILINVVTILYIVINPSETGVVCDEQQSNEKEAAVALQASCLLLIG